MKGVIENSIAIVWEFNTPFSIIGRTTGQKTNKDMKELNNTINQLDFMKYMEHSTQWLQNTNLSKYTCNILWDISLLNHKTALRWKWSKSYKVYSPTKTIKLGTNRKKSMKSQICSN